MIDPKTIPTRVGKSIRPGWNRNRRGDYGYFTDRGQGPHLDLLVYKRHAGAARVVAGKWGVSTNPPLPPLQASARTLSAALEQAEEFLEMVK